jgi:hypothetical protein
MAKKGKKQAPPKRSKPSGALDDRQVDGAAGGFSEIVITKPTDTSSTK